MPQTLGKKELCKALGWNRPKLDRVLKRDENFPIISRGDQSGGWCFDLEAVQKYLAGDTKPPHQEDGVSVPPAQPGRRSAYHQGEASAKQRKDSAEADFREIKVAELAGDLVPKAQVEQVLSTLIVHLANELDGLPEQIVKACGIPFEATEGIRKKIDLFRANIVADSETFLKAES
jgi:phage terminase Nu1 subunit (DNA packaging protein)